VQGILTAYAIAYMQDRTSAGYFIRQAPKEPCCTRGEGHPTFKLMLSYPYFSPSLAASANFSGSDPDAFTAA
jgi:hypothetical protein